MERIKRLKLLLIDKTVTPKIEGKTGQMIIENFIPEKIKYFIIIWSVFPSMLGIIVLSINNNLSLLMLSIGFFLCQLVDEIFNKYLSFPNWYLPLRRILTLIVVIVLIFSYFIIQTP